MVGRFAQLWIGGCVHGYVISGFNDWWDYCENLCIAPFIVWIVHQSELNSLTSSKSSNKPKFCGWEGSFLTQRRDAPVTKSSGCLSDANPKDRKGPRGTEKTELFMFFESYFRFCNTIQATPNRWRFSPSEKFLYFPFFYRTSLFLCVTLRLCVEINCRF